SPAMNADTANNPSFVLTGDTPDVAAAVSAVRTATIARPDADRLRLVTNHTVSRTSPSNSMMKLRSSTKWNGPMDGRFSGHPPAFTLANSATWNRTRSPMNASASVANASATPPSRNDGHATTTP